ncbi:MAG: MFS transporter [Hyphomicrobiaceae bacterium]
MTGMLRPVTALLLATAIITLGHGLQGVLLPLRAQHDGFSDVEIGLIGSAYFLGQLGGCLLAPGVIGRVGHIRAFAAFSAVASTTPLIHAMAGEAIVWFVLRLINGVSFAGVFLVIESWLAASSEDNTRGRVLGAYTLIHLTVVMAGMQLISLGSPLQFELFSLVSVLFSLALLPIALTATIAPVPPRRAKLRIRPLFAASPAAWSAAFLCGITNGAFWMMGPIFAQQAGMSPAHVALFIATGVLAGAIAQWPAGSLSDRLGRRGPLAITSALAAAAGIALATIDQHQSGLLFMSMAIFGAANFPIYILSLAHANDMVSKRRAVSVASGLLLVFSIGAVIGPAVSAYAMSVFGPAALFVTTAVVHTLIVLIVVVRVRIRPRLSKRYREDFVLVPRTTPAIYELDPRTDPLAEAPEPPSSEPAPMASAEQLVPEKEGSAETIVV